MGFNKLKNLIITINCFLCLSIYTYSQNFFPVSVGNEYQVRNHWHSWGPGGYNNYGTYFNVTTAVKDTLINGELFYLLQNDGNTNPFDSDFLFRYDSLEQKLYIKISGNDSVRLAADFNTAADSHYTSYITGSPREFISSGLSYEEVLGDSLWVYKMENPLNDVYTHTFYFADQIGIYYYKYLESNPPFTGYTSEYNVISAILDSSFVNQLVLKIDSLHPVIDRPIDTFPFLLNIPFHCSYSELIENFILIIEIERDSSIIFNQNYNIPYSNPHFQLNPTNLEVGI